jgi:hypothetical protein
VNNFYKILKKESDRRLKETRQELRNIPEGPGPGYAVIALRNYRTAMTAFEDFANTLNVANRAELIEHAQTLRADIETVLALPAANIVRDNCLP